MDYLRIKKFENPTRIAELRPEETLKKAGFKDGMSLCDIGAGTGIFALPAALITSEEIYALDISDEMIEILETRKEERDLYNMEVIKVTSETLPLKDKSCDMAIMVTVLHEIENKNMILKEIRRILKPNGILMIIEFYKNQTIMGPPMEIRISEKELLSMLRAEHFEIEKKFVLGENLYGVIGKKLAIFR